MRKFKKSKKINIKIRPIKIMSFNILAPELLEAFWNPSYQLKKPTKTELKAILTKKRENIMNIIKLEKPDILCLQEVSVPLSSSKTINSINYRKEMEKEWKSLGMKIANLSFKQSPISYEKPFQVKEDQATNTSKHWSQKKNQVDSGILTMYDPRVIKYLKSIRAEDFGKDTTNYEYNQTLPEDVLKIREKTKKNQEADSLNLKPCSFKKSWYCKTKQMSSIGTPFCLDTFQFINQKESTFHILNVHVRMNFPRIDSFKTVLDRIKSKQFDGWETTLMNGDFNTSEQMAHKTIKKMLRGTQQKRLFSGRDDIRFYTGRKIKIHSKKKSQIPLLKFRVHQKKSKIRKNNKLVQSQFFSSDHPPIIVDFSLKS